MIYSLPFSLAFTFTGTFLTLDGTRTVPNRGTGTVYLSLSIPGSSSTFKKRKLNWVIFGQRDDRIPYLATPLFLIPAIVVQIFPGSIGVYLQVVSLRCLCVSPRVILTITFLLLFLILALILATAPRFNGLVFHAFLWICTTSIGAFGLTLIYRFALKSSGTVLGLRLGAVYGSMTGSTGSPVESMV